MLDKKVVTIKDYGSIKIRLKEYLDERKINRNMLARFIGSRFEVVDNWYTGNLSKVDLDVLARICYVLDCKVSDLLEYSPDPAVMEIEDAEAEKLPEA